MFKKSKKTKNTKVTSLFGHENDLENFDKINQE